MQFDLQRSLNDIENMIRIQRNCVDRGYMHGMLNGLILAHSAVSNEHPVYESLPRRKNNIRHKLRKKDD
jgi:hypothetical protein